MAASCAPAVLLMLLLAPPGSTPAVALQGVWTGLGCIMVLRWFIIWMTYRARKGPFSVLFPTEGGKPAGSGSKKKRAAKSTR